MSAITWEPHDNPTERLVVAIFIAMLLHILLVFGVGLDWQRSDPSENTMEIVLVQSATETENPDADFLAQAANQGGGEAEEKHRPATPVRAPFPDPEPRVVTTTAPPASAAQARPEQTRELTVDQNRRQRNRRATTPSHDPAPRPSPQNRESPVPTQQISTAALIMNARASVASLQAELDREYENWSKRPRHKHIGVNTREYKYASYMESWRNKVERIGNMNYPDDVRREGLSGELVLQVALNANGTVYEVKILTPSRHAALDDAALRIVRLASPFAPFPDSIKDEADVLHITRRWQFSSEGMVSDL